MGTTVEIGDTLAGVGISITDYSKKSTDDFGVTSVVERSYARRIESQILVENKRIDFVAKQLASVRATPAVWIISDARAATVAYGFYKDWSIDIPYPTHSQARLMIEGLA